MTAEADFHAALDRDPGDGNARLALADWLDENARDVPCERCGGTGRGDPKLGLVPTADGGLRYSGRPVCRACRGFGMMSDGRRERAAGYRAMAELGIRPFRDGLLCDFYSTREPGEGPTAPWRLPREWAARVRLDGALGTYFPAHSVRPDCPRRELDDAVAIAFGRLPPEVQARILAGVTA